MIRRLSPSPFILLVALLFSLPACDDRDPPQVDDDQLSAEIRDQYLAVQQTSEARQADISQSIDEARSQIDLAIESADEISDDVFILD